MGWFIVTALAVCCNDPKQFKNHFVFLKAKGYKLFGLLDAGSAGLKLKKYLDYSLQLPEGDVGDLSEEELVRYVTLVFNFVKAFIEVP